MTVARRRDLRGAKLRAGLGILFFVGAYAIHAAVTPQLQSAIRGSTLSDSLSAVPEAEQCAGLRIDTACHGKSYRALCLIRLIRSYPIEQNPNARRS
jgi:hypothetical protein